MTPNPFRRSITILRSAAGGLAALLLFVGSSFAQEVTITSRQGNLTLTGRASGYDGTYLEIESQYGPLTLAYAGVTCVGDNCPHPDNVAPRLRMTGEPLLSNLLLPALLDGYARDRNLSLTRDSSDDGHTTSILTNAEGDQVLTVVLRPTQSAEAFADLLTFDTDVALTFRDPSPAEAARASDIGVSLNGDAGRIVILGSDALVVIVSPRNQVRTIDPAAVVKAFTGDVADWGMLGQPERPLTLHLGPQGDGQAEAFLALLPGKASPSIVRHPSAADLAAAVAADAGALGVTALGATAVAQPLGLRDACGLTTAPRLTEIKTQDYPLATPAFAFVRSVRQQDVVRDFLDWLRSPTAQLIVRRAGLADRGVVPIPLDDQGERFAHAIAIAGPDTSLLDLQEMVGIMKARARVSLTFRFSNGTTDLDTASAANLRTLAQDIRDGRYAGREIMLIGFSDGEGSAQPNRDLSAARAVTVETALLSLLGKTPEDVRIGTAGFGEALPMGCDDTVWGRRMNRRVEVWVGD